MEPNRSIRALVVDDSDTMRMMLVMLLRKLGITEVLQAGDGDDALAVLRSQNVDLLLLDCVMPRVGGLEVLQTVRSDPALASLPVILVTGNNDEQTAQAAQAADAIVFKPLSFADVKAAVEKARARPAG